MTVKKASERTFGIEIECYIPNDQMSGFALGSYHSGIQCSALPEGWRGERDGSVTGYAPTGYTGIEIVSPILKGEAGLCELWAVEDLLHNLGAITNEHCGHHVHVDAKDLDERQIGLLVGTFADYETLFYSMAGKNALARYNNSYCQPIRRYSIEGDRYRSLNLHNSWVPQGGMAFRQRQFGHGTVECRIFPGNIIPMWAVTWAYMFNGLVSYVASLPTDASEDGTYMVRGIMPTPMQAERFITDILGNPDCRIIPDELAPDLETIIRKQVERAQANNFC